MKITFEKSDLMETLKVSILAVGSGAGGAGGDLATYLVFRLLGDKVEVLSQNGRLSSIRTLRCKVSQESEDAEENRFSMEAKRLMKWLRAVPEGKMSFRYHKGKVIARTSRGQVSFRHKDVAAFPFWDGFFKSADVIVEMPSERFVDILTGVSPFVSTNESQTPEICSCEFRDGEGGKLYGMDEASVSMVTVPGMEKSKARINGKEIGHLVKFLRLFKEETITIKECPRFLFLVAEDGTSIGQSRDGHEFPDLLIESPFEEAHFWWTFSPKDMEEALRFLIPTASVDEVEGGGVRLRLKDDKLELLMDSAAGDQNTQEIPCFETRTSDNPLPLPQEGFSLSHDYVLRVLRQQEDKDRIEMGVCKMVDEHGDDDGGYVAFQETSEAGDIYMTILGWYGA